MTAGLVPDGSNRTTGRYVSRGIRLTWSEGELTEGQPVISVDTKKKELVGNFTNAGREWHPKGEPPGVRNH